MDQKALALLARFAATLRRAGLALDMVRFVNEDDYAMSVLDGAFQSTDESVVVTALSIAQSRGLLNRAGKTERVGTRIDPAKDRQTQEHDSESGSKVENPTQRYVRSLR